MLGYLITSLDILGLLCLPFLNLLSYLPITHSLFINRGLCIHIINNHTQYNVVHYSLMLSILSLSFFRSPYIIYSTIFQCSLRRSHFFGRPRAAKQSSAQKLFHAFITSSSGKIYTRFMFARHISMEDLLPLVVPRFSGSPRAHHMN
jgi:hypothetical protein